MKTINHTQLDAVSGGINISASEAKGTATNVMTGAATVAGAAAGGAIGGPLGAVVGAAIGGATGHVLGNHTDVIATAVNSYAQGHKDAQFTGMPMAFQK